MGISVRTVDRIGPYQNKSKALMNLAVRKAAFDIEAKAKDRCPVGETGNLRAGINANGGGLDWRVDAPADYAIYVHQGTRYMAGRPFLVSSLEEVRPTLLAALRSL